MSAWNSHITWEKWKRTALQSPKKKRKQETGIKISKTNHEEGKEKNIAVMKTEKKKNDRQSRQTKPKGKHAWQHNTRTWNNAKNKPWQHKKMK